METNLVNGPNRSQDPDYVGPVGHEKRMHQNVFGPMNLDAPECVENGCTRISWMGEHCPDHKSPEEGADSV